MPLPEKRYTSDDYWNLPDGERAELINGQLYMMAPPSRLHQELVHQLSRVIGNYISDKRGDCKIYPAPFAVNLNADDTVYVEPDISVICSKDKLTDKGCVGAPDFIIEIVSPGSRKLDYSIKMANMPRQVSANTGLSTLKKNERLFTIMTKIPLRS